MKVYRQHYCERNHRTMAAVAKCLWPRAVWVHGEGEYACLAWCGSGPRPGPALTVELFTTAAAAEGAKAAIDHGGCGGRCEGERRHELVHMDIE